MQSIRNFCWWWMLVGVIGLNSSLSTHAQWTEMKNPLSSCERGQFSSNDYEQVTCTNNETSDYVQFVCQTNRTLSVIAMQPNRKCVVVTKPIRYVENGETWERTGGETCLGLMLDTNFSSFLSQVDAIESQYRDQCEGEVLYEYFWLSVGVTLYTPCNADDLAEGAPTVLRGSETSNDFNRSLALKTGSIIRQYDRKCVSNTTSQLDSDGSVVPTTTPQDLDNSSGRQFLWASWYGFLFLWLLLPLAQY